MTGASARAEHKGGPHLPKPATVYMLEARDLPLSMTEPSRATWAQQQASRVRCEAGGRKHELRSVQCAACSNKAEARLGQEARASTDQCIATRRVGPLHAAAVRAVWCPSSSNVSHALTQAKGRGQPRTGVLQPDPEVWGRMRASAYRNTTG
jgi:hypothetical protein